MEIEGFTNYLIYEDGRVFNKTTNEFMKITYCISKNSQVINLSNKGKQKCFTIKTLIGKYYTPQGGKPIEGFPKYLVYPDGKVFSFTKGGFLQPTQTRGYNQVCIGHKPRKTVLVHRLVAKAFIPNPDNLPFIDHKDRDRGNNNVDNLRWCTRRDNNCNKSKQKNNTSGYTGIIQNEYGSWKSTYRLGKDDKGNNLQKSKTFKTIEEAIRFRKEMVRLHYNRPEIV